MAFSGVLVKNGLDYKLNSLNATVKQFFFIPPIICVSKITG